jgi:hypothetical protein
MVGRLERASRTKPSSLTSASGCVDHVTMLQQLHRWKFLSERDPRERAGLRALEDAIDTWWRNLVTKVPDVEAYLRGSRWDLPEWMAQNLGAVHPELMWEFGPGTGPDGGRRLVITPESSPHLRPLVDRILARAPRLPGWEFHGHRLAESVQVARRAVRARAGGDLSTYEVRVEPAEHGLVALEFRSRDCKGPDDKDALSAAFIAAETLLGEDVLDQWIGPIEVVRAPSKWTAWLPIGGVPPVALPLEQLRDAVTAIISARRASLPELPWMHRSETAAWVTLSRDAPVLDDYCEQDDLHFSITPDEALLEAAHTHLRFYSERFSAHGETFCYVKLDASDDEGQRLRENRPQLEEHIHAALVRSGLGSTIGGGIGVRYAYVNLALLDLDRSIPVLVDVLRAAGAPKRSWIQFYDAPLRREWVEIHDDAPRPPMPELE